MPRVFALLLFGCLGLVLPATAAAETSPTGGAQFSDPTPIVAPGAKATLLPDGTAARAPGADAHVPRPQQAHGWAREGRLSRGGGSGGRAMRAAAGSGSLAVADAGAARTPGARSCRAAWKRW